MNTPPKVFECPQFVSPAGAGDAPDWSSLVRETSPWLLARLRRRVGRDAAEDSSRKRSCG